MPGSKGLLWLQEQGISPYGISNDANARNTTGALHMRGPTHENHASWDDLVDDPADLPYPSTVPNTWSTSVSPDCTPDMVPRTAEARIQWVLSALKSIPGVEMLEETARALVTIPVGNQV